MLPVLYLKISAPADLPTVVRCQSPLQMCHLGELPLVYTAHSQHIIAQITPVAAARTGGHTSPVQVCLNVLHAFELVI
jgi:hypothetical protein